MTRKRTEAEHYYNELPKSKANLGLVRTQLRGEPFEFLTASSVFSKTRVDLGSRLLIESMILPESGTILDVGCGYGAVGIAAATFNPRLHIVMTDVNARAVQLARYNCERNRVTNCDVRHGHLYDPVKGVTFKVVLSNPPVSAGMGTVKAIISGAAEVMDEGATFQMVIRSKIGAKTLPDLLIEHFGACDILARQSGYRVLSAQKR
jgi:16S rRNA (guanine1207-N2)-methyltransferase